MATVTLHTPTLVSTKSTELTGSVLFEAVLVIRTGQPFPALGANAKSSGPNARPRPDGRPWDAKGGTARQLVNGLICNSHLQIGHTQGALPLDALLDLLACPMTGEIGLGFDGDWGGEGIVTTPSGRAYPVLEGIPRMLPPELLGPFLGTVSPGFVSRWPAVEASLDATRAAEPEVLETLVAYSFHHMKLGDIEPEVEEWKASWDRFQPGAPPSSFAGQVVLEVGCGEGRHTWLVGDHAKLTVGMDLSRGVEVARRRDKRPTSFYVQGDLRRPPFRPGAFDAMYSNGVLHHTPDPGASFAAVARLVRPGGRILLWLYGLEGMRWTYRLSHLTWLRPISNRMPKPGKLAITAWLTACIEAGLWTPARILRRAGLEDLARRIPYNDAASKEWRHKFRRIFDRINPPITHYLSRSELEQWFAGYDNVEIRDAYGQGWCVNARAPATQKS